MSDINEIVARNIRTRMMASDLTNKQTKLAGRAKISQSHVSRLINKASSATIGRLAKVAHALGCEPYELLLDDDQARRALIERLMSGPHVSTERVEQAGFVPISSAPAKKRSRKAN